jgi:hypothetical protein
MAHRFFWAFLEFHNFENFCPFSTFERSKCSYALNWNSVIRVRVRERCAKDVNSGSLTGLEIV